MKKMETRANVGTANLVAEEKASNIFDFNKAAQEAEDLFDYLKYKWARGTKETIATKLFPVWWDAKATIRKILRNHINWDERQQAIIYDSSYETGIDMAHAHEACRWFYEQMAKIRMKYAVPFDYERYLEVSRKYDVANDIYENYKSRLDQDVNTALVAQKYEYLDEYIRLQKEKNKLTRCTDPETGERYFIPIEISRRISDIRDFFNYYDYRSNVADEEFVTKVNGLGDYNATVGQKVSRIINKICKEFGLDKIKIMKEIVRHRGTDSETTEMKDYGYNYYFAMFGDAVNPLHIRKYTVISINPMDYWTSSFFKNTASCHTIDKLNVRGVGDNEHVYGGMYSAGTESYMLDNATVVMYTVDSSYSGDMWKADKDRRMLFHIGENGQHFVFGRLYPDGRDGGETGLAAQFRNVVQKILSECLGFNNLWKVVKGAYEVGKFTKSTGMHYRDYTNYDDCGYSYVTGTEMKTINIGHDTICPYCGKGHCETGNGDRESVFCFKHNDMMGRYTCESCGCTIDEDESEYYYCEDTEEYYCCDSCAHDHDVVRCEDDDHFHSEDNCYQDYHTDAWYSQDYINWHVCIETEDGNWFANEENARAEEYVCTGDNGYWISQDEAFYDNYDECWYADNDYDYIYIDGYCYKNEENATEDGWILNDDDEWVRA